MPDILSGGAGHFTFWPCILNKRCAANIDCLYKAFALILLSPVYFLILLRLDIMSRELANFYRIYRTCPAKLEKFKMFVYFGL